MRREKESSENESKPNLFKRMDIFGKPVSLKFGGQSSYKTGCGALHSILFMIGILVIFMSRLRNLIIGRKLGHIITSDGQTLDDETLNQSLDVLGLDFRVGF
jgi:hypothetical protein